MQAAERHGVEIQRPVWPLDREAAWRAFVLVVENVEPTSSPGYPLCLSFPTNRDFLYGPDGAFSGRVGQLFEDWCRTLDDLIDRPTYGWIRLFQKREVHSATKLAEGRFRLISSVSLLDQLVDAYLLNPVIQAEAKLWRELPSAVGWGHKQHCTTHRALLDSFAALVMESDTWLLLCDKSYWDWCYREWMHYFNAWVYCYIYGDPVITKMVLHRYRAMARVVFYLSSGRVVTPAEYAVLGIQKSGFCGTIADNSRVQWLLHVMYLVRHGASLWDAAIRALGDDTAELFKFDPADYKAFLESFGLVVKQTAFRVVPIPKGRKDLLLGPNGVDFASCYFDPVLLPHGKKCLVPHMLPKSFEKMWMNFLLEEFDSSAFYSLCDFASVDAAQWHMVEKLCSLVGIALPDREFHLYRMAGMKIQSKGDSGAGVATLRPPDTQAAA